MAITLDPSTVLNVTLSNGDLTATNTSTANPSGAKGAAADAKTSGKLYFEFTGMSSNGGSQMSVGVATQSDTYSAVVSTGGGGGGIMLYQGSNGVVFSGGSSRGQISSTIGPSDIIAVAIDIGNGKAWFRKLATGQFWNGSSSNDPATNVGGDAFSETSLVPFVGFGGGGSTGVAVTLNLAGPFNGTVPSGFSAWDSSGPTSPTGTLAVTENADGMSALGYAGPPGPTGFLNSSEAADTAAMTGFVASVGPLTASETPDTFSAYVTLPVTGHLAASEAPDRMAATGLGRGENGTMAASESIDTAAIIGYTPSSGTLAASENPDRARFVGAGVTTARQRRVFFVT